MSNCPICETPDITPIDNSNGPWQRAYKLSCLRCGTFWIDLGLFSGLPKVSKNSIDNQWRQVVSHFLRQKDHEGEAILLTDDLFEKLKRTEAPSFPMEQAKNIINWFGDEGLKKQGKRVQPEPWIGMISIAGAQDGNGLTYIISGLMEQDLLENTPPIGYQLTFKGWNRYEELKRNKSDSQSAFMAMQFNEKELQSLYEDHFRKAVKATGFNLSTVKGRAGPITDHIKNDIRLARFVVADLTHHNNGAYWEAGFAEGLGKPVFYTCKESVFKGKKKPHFDIKHHRIIFWGKTSSEETAEELKALIRSTLPLEAIMQDKQP